jgi:hypothetical protein
MKIVTLAESEAKAADGNLCWQHPRNGPFRYGLACSRERGHVGDYGAGGCRFDMRIEVPTWTRSRIRLAVAIGLACLLLGSTVGRFA